MRFLVLPAGSEFITGGVAPLVAQVTAPLFTCLFPWRSPAFQSCPSDANPKDGRVVHKFLMWGQPP